MAPSQDADLFNKIIAEGRERQKNEVIANAMLGGSSRRASAPGLGNTRRVAGGSLASRVGISKATRVSSPLARPYSAAPPSTFRNGSSLHSRPLSRTSSDSRLDRKARAVETLANADTHPSSLRNQVNFRDDTTNGGGFSFRGQASAELVTVVAQNFAEGTTAADIEAVLQPLVIEDVNCRIVAARPTVIAEMQFLDPSSADIVVSTFNNKKADGRQLYVYIKDGTNTPSASSKAHAASRNGRGDLIQRDGRGERDDEMLDVDEDRRRYDEQRRHDEERRNRRADPEYQDGRYGFGDRRGQDPRPARDFQDRVERGLYSDSMVRGRRGGGSHRGGGGFGGR